MATTSLKSLQVLVVEDNPTLMLAHSKMLEHLGCTTTCAVNGKQAIAMAQHHYDLILLDIGLPDIDGFDVAATIRQQTHIHPHIIALTGYPIENLKNACVEAGIDQIASKPVMPDTLKSFLASF